MGFFRFLRVGEGSLTEDLPMRTVRWDDGIRERVQSGGALRHYPCHRCDDGSAHLGVWGSGGASCLRCGWKGTVRIIGAPEDSAQSGGIAPIPPIVDASGIPWGDLDSADQVRIVAICRWTWPSWEESETLRILSRCHFETESHFQISFPVRALFGGAGSWVRRWSFSLRQLPKVPSGLRNAPFGPLSRKGHWYRFGAVGAASLTDSPILPSRRAIALVEGLGDAVGYLSLSTKAGKGVPGVPVMTGGSGGLHSVYNIPKVYPWVDTVLLGFDHDEAGRRFTRAVGSYFLSEGLQVSLIHPIRGKDLGEAEDFSEILVDSLKTLLDTVRTWA